MTTQHQVIAICVIAFISIPLGTFTMIKCIKKLSRPPVNVLHRPGNIQLDHIEPTRPQDIYNYPDLLVPQFERISNYTSYYRTPHSYPPSYQPGNPPSYRSESLPNYYIDDRGYINSCLENAINLEFILWLILFSIVLILIIKFYKMLTNTSFNLLGR